MTTLQTARARLAPPAPQYGLKGTVAEKVLGRILRKVPVNVTLPGGAHLGPTPSPGRPEIQILKPRQFFARLADSPMIGLGEAYMERDWNPAPGSDLADVLAPFAARLTDLIPPTFYRMRHMVMPKLGSREENTVTGARENIHRHYDLSNDMFAQFLDPSLMYSSALFDSLSTPPSVDDLEGAQAEKIDRILDRAGVREGSRVLEIGTGWGTLAIRAAERGAQVVTVTISEHQAELAQQRVDAAGVTDLIEIRLQDYRDVTGEFDAIVSVEMIEAVGEKYWPTYFAKIDELLAPQGKVVIQAILLEHHRMVATRNTYTWIHKYIFPGGLLPSTEAIAGVLDQHTSMRITENFSMGQHYAHTLRLWREKFLANWDAIAPLGFDDQFRRMWEFYLAYCEAGFRTGYLDVSQIRMER